MSVIEFPCFQTDILKTFKFKCFQPKSIETLKFELLMAKVNKRTKNDKIEFQYHGKVSLQHREQI